MSCYDQGEFLMRTQLCYCYPGILGLIHEPGGLAGAPFLRLLRSQLADIALFLSESVVSHQGVKYARNIYRIVTLQLTGDALR